MPFFKYEGQRLAYTEFGGGPAAVTSDGRARAHREERAGAARAR